MSDLAVVGLEWLGGVTVFLAFILFLRYLEHRERMSMIERGLIHPEAGQRPRYLRGSAQLRGGLITAGVGFALTVGLYNLGWLLPAPLTAAPGRIGPWLLPGLIPLAIGIALIAGYYLSPPHQESQQEAPNTQTELDELAKDDTVAQPGHVGQRIGWHVLGAGHTAEGKSGSGAQADSTTTTTSDAAEDEASSQG